MAPRDRGKGLPPELRLLAQRLLSRESDDVPLENLTEVAKFLGTRLMTFEADPRRRRDEDAASPPGATKSLDERMLEECEGEILKDQARTLGVPLVTVDKARR
jgi:hypothetical protein